MSNTLNNGSTPTAVDVFDMQGIVDALTKGNNNLGQMSFLDATQNADGSYTVANNGQVWAGPLSNANEYAGDNGMANIVRFFDPYTGVIQLQISGSGGTNGAPPNGTPAQDGFNQGYVQGQIVGWSGDSLLIKLYGALNLQTGVLSDPLTSSDTQTAYILFSAEDMTGTSGIPTTGATLGQPTDATTLASLATTLGIYPPIPASSVDASGMVTSVGTNLTMAYAAYVQVTDNGDGTFSAAMNTAFQSPYQALSASFDPTSYSIDISASYPGGIVKVDIALNGTDENSLGYGKIIGWNQDGVLLQMYGTYSKGVLSNLSGGSSQFIFLSGNNLSLNAFTSSSPEVVGQDTTNLPADFGLAAATPAATVTTPFDPASIANVNGLSAQFKAGNVVLTDATQNVDGTYTLNLGSEPWAGGVAQWGKSATDVSLGIAVSYSNPVNGAVAFTFTSVSGSVVPSSLSGTFYGKIVAWDYGDYLIRLYSNMDPTTGALSGPVNPSQGPSYMLISAKDLGSFQAQGAGAINGLTLGQSNDTYTASQLQTNLGLTQVNTASNVDLSSLAASLNGLSTNNGAFVSAVDNNNGTYTINATANPYISPTNLTKGIGYPGYSDFTDNLKGASTATGYTVQVTNVYSGGVFQWDLNNPNPPSASTNQTLKGQATVDQFYAKIIGYDADGVLVENYTSYVNGVLSGLATGKQQYAFFSTNNLQAAGVTNEVVGQDTTQLPTTLGVAAGPAAAPPTAASVFDMQSVANAINTTAAASPVRSVQLSFLDATQNADGSYTVVNNGEVWAGPLSNGNEYGQDSSLGPNITFLNPYTGVIQIKLPNTSGGTPIPNGAPAENGWAQGTIQGQIVAWDGDSLLIELYDNLNVETGQLGNPVTSSPDQAAYLLLSSEDMAGTSGIPTSGATLGQATDTATLSALATNFGIYAPIPAANVDASGMVTNVGANLNDTHLGFVQVVNNGDGTFSASMSGVEFNQTAGYVPLSQFDGNGWGIDIVAAYPGGIIKIDDTLNQQDEHNIGYGKIIGWNQDGVLVQLYSTYSDGVLSGLRASANQFAFISEQDLSVNPIPAGSPEVFGQDPTNFPPDFGLAVPASPLQTTLDPGSLGSINAANFGNTGLFGYWGQLSAGHIVLADATQNADGSFTLGFNGESWAGGAANPNKYGSDVPLTINIKYSNATTGAVDFTLSTPSGYTLPSALGGDFYGRIVGWNGGNVLLQLFSSLDQTTGALSGPVSSSQGPAYMLISATDFGNAGSQGGGTVGGMTLGQPTDLDTLSQLQTNLGISQVSATSNVDLSGLPAALDGKSTDFGAFVNVSNLGNGTYSATDKFQPPVYNYASSHSGYKGYSDFTDNQAAADLYPTFTIKIDNVLGTGVFEWELDAPTPPDSTYYALHGATVIDHFFAKVIGFNADGILVENYQSYSNGQLSNLVGGLTQYAYFSTNDLKTTDISSTPAQFSQDTSQLPNALGVNAAMPCFATGTRIRTPHGDVAVEDIGEGDAVVTVSGVVRPVVWVGHRRVECARHPEPAKVWPVRVAAGAFGPGLPAHDLYLSPDHALFVDGALIPVKYLINGDTVAQVATDEVTYYHVELDCHDVLLAEDLPAESFLDTGNRDSFANGGSSIRLTPDFAADWNARMWEAHACAPLVLCGSQLDAARARLRQHADDLAASSRVAA